MSQAWFTVASIVNWTSLVVTTQTEIASSSAETNTKPVVEAEDDGTNKDGCCTRRRSALQDRYNEALKLRPPLVIHIVLIITVFVILCGTGGQYYETTNGISGTTVNVNGAGAADVVGNRQKKWELWDATDVTTPPEENNIFFIATKIVRTNQTRGTCPESNFSPHAKCSSNNSCKRGSIDGMGNGITTGSCESGICAVDSWCPVEGSVDSNSEELLNGTGNFTILVKNHVYFEYGDGVNKRYNNFKNCRYNEHGDYSLYDKTETNSCPLFPLTAIVEEAIGSNIDSNNYEHIKANGAIISIRLKWDCNTDAADDCWPSYHFTRLDTAFNDSSRHGYSFSETIHPYGDKESRTFVRSTGVLIMIETHASANRVTLIQVLTHVGVGFASIKGVKAFKHFICYTIAVIILIRAHCKKKNDDDIQMINDSN